MSDITELPKIKYINSHLYEAIRHLSTAAAYVDELIGRYPEHAEKLGTLLETIMVAWQSANDAHNTLVLNKALKELGLR